MNNHLYSTKRHKFEILTQFLVIEGESDKGNAK